MRHTLIAGFEDLFKKTELKLPCVLSVRNFDVFRVVKQLAVALDVRSKFWQTEEQLRSTTITHYYAVLFDNPITGKEISKLVEDFERQS